ncbi:signal transduction protein [Halobacteriales archaeon SW_7_68_16]|nr:MAG: signal transduction protein [Halobacteriales archaeon SW_7_68_16]
MQVTDMMTPRSAVATVSLPGTRADALDRLKELSFSSLPVVTADEDGERFRGLVTRDALIENPDEDQLALLMEESVPTIGPDASVEDLATLIVREDQRRVPVVDGELVGIVTVTDAVRAIATGDVPGETAVEAIATPDVNTTYRGTPLSVAERELFYANEPYAVVLCDEGDMCGIVTAVDVLTVAEVVEGEEATGESIAAQDEEWMWEGIKAVGNRYLPTRNVEIPDEPVAEFMTDDVRSVGTRTTVAEAARLMLEHEFEQVPLVAGDRLIGMVRDVDLLEAIHD